MDPEGAEAAGSPKKAELVTPERAGLGGLPEAVAERDPETGSLEAACSHPDPRRTVRSAEQRSGESPGRHRREKEEDRRLLRPRRVRAHVQLRERQHPKAPDPAGLDAEGRQRNDRTAVDPARP